MTWHEVASSSTVVSKESMIPASQLVDVSEVKKHNQILLLMLVMQLLGFEISLVQKFFRGCRKIEFQSKRSAVR